MSHKKFWETNDIKISSQTEGIEVELIAEVQTRVHATDNLDDNITVQTKNLTSHRLTRNSPAIKVKPFVEQNRQDNTELPAPLSLEEALENGIVSLGNGEKPSIVSKKDVKKENEKNISFFKRLLKKKRKKEQQKKERKLKEKEPYPFDERFQDKKNRHDQYEVASDEYRQKSTLETINDYFSSLFDCGTEYEGVVDEGENPDIISKGLSSIPTSKNSGSKTATAKNSFYETMSSAKELFTRSFGRSM